MAKLTANALLFNLGWLLCVAAPQGIALAFAAAYLALHFTWVSDDRRELGFVMLVAVIGLSSDALGIELGLFQLSSSGFPWWLLALWLLFATTLNHCLAWLKGSLLLSAALGAFAGTSSYYAATRLGAAEVSEPLWLTLIFWAVLWGFLLPLFVALSRGLRIGEVAREVSI